MASIIKPAKPTYSVWSDRNMVSKPSFRHLKHQNQSNDDNSIHSSGIIFLVLFFATRQAVAPLANDPLCWRDQYGCLDTLNFKICPLFQILQTKKDGATIPEQSTVGLEYVITKGTVKALFKRIQDVCYYPPQFTFHNFLIISWTLYHHPNHYVLGNFFMKTQ